MNHMSNPGDRYVATVFRIQSIAYMEAAITSVEIGGGNPIIREGLALDVEELKQCIARSGRTGWSAESRAQLSFTGQIGGAILEELVDCLGAAERHSEISDELRLSVGGLLDALTAEFN